MQSINAKCSGNHSMMLVIKMHRDVLEKNIGSSTRVSQWGALQNGKSITTAAIFISD
jgi:hypothetical protein